MMAMMADACCLKMMPVTAVAVLATFREYQELAKCTWCLYASKL